MTFTQILTLMLSVTSLGLLAAILYIIKSNRGKREILNQKQHLFARKIELEAALDLLREKNEKEKESYSKTLHDEVGNSLASMKLIIDGFCRNLHGMEFEMMFTMQKELDRCLLIVRNISKDAYPPSLSQFGLGVAISELCERLNSQRFFTKISFHHTGEAMRLEPNKELILFRATQEFIGNSVKHSLAWYMDVSLIWAENELTISVEDNGVGYGEWKKDKGGIGLKSIESSLKAINTKVIIKRNPPGFKAKIIHPIHNETYQDLHSG